MAAVLSMTTGQPVETVEQMLEQWIAVKRREDEANAERVAIEQRISQVLHVPQEGAQTHQVGGYKVTLTGKLTYKVADVQQLISLAARLPEGMRPIKSEPKADEAGLKYLRNKEPALWALIAEAVEVKPAKVAVKVGL
jgi:hypothetical protein